MSSMLKVIVLLVALAVAVPAHPMFSENKNAVDPFNSESWAKLAINKDNINWQRVKRDDEATADEATTIGPDASKSSSLPAASVASSEKESANNPEQPKTEPAKDSGRQDPVVDTTTVAGTTTAPSSADSNSITTILLLSALVFVKGIYRMC